MLAWRHTHDGSKDSDPLTTECIRPCYSELSSFLQVIVSQDFILGSSPSILSHICWQTLTRKQSCLLAMVGVVSPSSSSCMRIRDDRRRMKDRRRPWRGPGASAALGVRKRVPDPPPPELDGCSALLGDRKRPAAGSSADCGDRNIAAAAAAAAAVVAVVCPPACAVARAHDTAGMGG